MHNMTHTRSFADISPTCQVVDMKIQLIGESTHVSLLMRGRLYSSCVQSSMLHGSETWSVRKENVVALQRAEMRMVRWMCGVKLKDRLPSKELRYDTRCYFNVRLKADMNRLNLPHGDDS